MQELDDFDEDLAHSGLWAKASKQSQLHCSVTSPRKPRLSPLETPAVLGTLRKPAMLLRGSKLLSSHTQLGGS